MPSETISQDLDQQVEEVSQEIRELDQRLAEAQQQIRQAEGRLDELNSRRQELAVGAFTGDEEATRELSELEDEYDQFDRKRRLAAAARPEFEQRLAAARERATELDKQIHWRRYSELGEELERTGPEADELARRIKKILEERSRLRSEMVAEIRATGDWAEANAMQERVERENAVWLREVFSGWLGRT
jgi:chromosome segregation ATPase